MIDATLICCQHSAGIEGATRKTAAGGGDLGRCEVFHPDEREDRAAVQATVRHFKMDMAPLILPFSLERQAWQAGKGASTPAPAEMRVLNAGATDDSVRTQADRELMYNDELTAPRGRLTQR
jgi:hypothetical protein